MAQIFILQVYKQYKAIMKQNKDSCSFGEFPELQSQFVCFIFYTLYFTSLKMILWTTRQRS